MTLSSALHLSFGVVWVGVCCFAGLFFFFGWGGLPSSLCGGRCQRESVLCIGLH